MINPVKYIFAKFLDLIVLGAMGVIAGGIISGFSYQFLATPAAMLYTVAAVELLINPNRCCNGCFMTLSFVGLYLLFMFQWFVIIIYGESLFPSLWWAVHGLSAIYIYSSTRSTAK